jgi:hypothetical protein
MQDWGLSLARMQLIDTADLDRMRDSNPSAQRHFCPCQRLLTCQLGFGFGVLGSERMDLFLNLPEGLRKRYRWAENRVRGREGRSDATRRRDDERGSRASDEIEHAADAVTGLSV